MEHARELSADAVLLASELVAQAMSAGARPRSLSLDCHVSRLEITVTTAGPRSRPVPSPHDRLRAFLIEQVALGWGTEERDGGLRLWCVFGSRVPVEVPQLT